MSRVLVLDEHYASALVLRLAIEERGHECRLTTSADEALAQVVVFRPQLVLYEWNLKGGIGFAARLRALVDRSRVPIVAALSAQSPPDDFCAREQLDGYVVKPFTAGGLDSLFAQISASEKL